MGQSFGSQEFRSSIGAGPLLRDTDFAPSESNALVTILAKFFQQTDNATLGSQS
jgi:hypothetical protein